MATAYHAQSFAPGCVGEELFANYNRRTVEPKPTKYDSHTCPFCEQRLPETRATIWNTFLGGIGRFAVAIYMILAAILRCVRLVVAATFCLLGLIGSFFRTLGLRVAHVDDRRLFGGDKEHGRA